MQPIGSKLIILINHSMNEETMVSTILIICLLITFIISFLLIVWWIPQAKRAGLVGKDMHKIEERFVAEIGGFPVLIGFLFGALLFVGIRTFFFRDDSFLLEILAVCATLLLVGLIGFVDDLLGWKIGLRQWQKPVLCFVAALPMMMINSGVSTMDIPGVGIIQLGLLYPLLIIPLAISAAANGFNMIAGYNGLEAGMGVLTLGTLGFIVWFGQRLGMVAMLAGLMVVALLAFLLLNWTPAKIFPGDALTYPVGALIAIIAILGNAEKAALFLFILYILEFFLKARGGWRKESFAHVQKDGNLGVPYAKIYGVEHFALQIQNSVYGHATEKMTVIVIFGVQVLICLVTAILFL